MRYDDILTALHAAGVRVYHPGARSGICTAPYAVVQNFGTYPYAQSRRLGYTLLTVHCYAPVGQYAALEALAAQVRDALAPLAPDLRPTGNEGIHTINDSFRAHECTVEYLTMHPLVHP